MTRINLTKVSTLSDQHLMIEYRELPRVLGLLDKHLAKGTKLSVILKGKPTNYTMGTGHVKFFYDKLVFLKNRHLELVQELHSRGFSIQYVNPLQIEKYPIALQQDYVPTPEAIAISQQRLNEKLAMRPKFYRMHGKLINQGE
ncbi:endonuclease [Shewanella phage Thanatos-1]|nr:endonuclease [Shewanella phage Thanatos-1]QLA10611.1 endonuclease [Shewanella phage Thanatos-2]